MFWWSVTMAMSLLLWSHGARWRQSRDVRTRAGVVRGYLVGERYYAFLGIPYSRPMTGNNRFKPPKPPESWSEPFDASRRLRCPQAAGSGYIGGEHCLVVNVMVGARPVPWTRPVLVIVHGGDFVSGWGAYKPPPRLIADFIVVTFNYRLGALGFLCLGTAEAPGNAGLKDQMAAIYWIQKNIEDFGGNPEDVTLYGVGSGAASVQMLLLSGFTAGLFHRVILECGSLLAPSMMTYAPYGTALQVATSLKYTGRTTEELVQFYKKLPVASLLNASLSFVPCVENTFYYHLTFFDKDPMAVLQSGNFDKVPMLVVYTNAQEVAVIKKAPELFHSVPESFENVLPNNLVFDSNFTRHRVGDVIRSFYFGSNVEDLSKEDMLQNYMEYVNDVFMDYPVVKFSMLYASKSLLPVYLMKFTLKHAKFGAVYDTLTGNVTDQTAAERLAHLWKNFMTINDPTPLTTSLAPLIWQPMRSEDQSHQLSISRASWLVFDSSLSMSNEPSQRLSFWDHIYSKFYKIHVFDKLDLDENE